MQLLVREMVRLQPPSYKGLTLIEVLIALAIVSVALVAIIKTTVQNIQATDYIKNKTVATWVGQQVLNEVRVGILVLSTTNELKQTTQFFGKKWYWEVGQEETANRRIKKITVKVSTHEITKHKESFLVNLGSYIYEKE